MRRTCARCLASASRRLDIVPIPCRVALRPISTSTPAFARSKPSAVVSSRIEGQNSQQDADQLTDNENASLESELDEDVRQLPEVLPLPNEQYISSWTSIGVPDIIARRLLTAFPHIQAPTPAQRALILSVQKSKDVFLKDHMGRGKTLGISIAVATLAYTSLKQSQKGIRQLVLLPSPHLLHQVERDLLALDPSFFHPDHPLAPEEEGSALFTILTYEVKAQDPEASNEVPNKTTEDAAAAAKRIAHTAPILLATPQDLLAQRSSVDLSGVKTIFLDEPEAMLPVLPGRHLSGQDLRRHPINRHPTPMMQIMNELMGIEVVKTEDRQEPRIRRDVGKGHINFRLQADTTKKRSVQTIWTSGTLEAEVKRLAKGRGWARKRDEVVDLEFTDGASQLQAEARQVAQDLSAGGQVRTEPISSVSGVEPTHYALVVDADTGSIESLREESVGLHDDVADPKGSVLPTILEALALVHAARPPPEGSYALAVPPEGISIERVVTELAELGIPAINLQPELIPDVDSLIPEPGQTPPVLLAKRSAVPGLHLPRLHTIYMLNGLDTSSTFKAAQVKDRMTFYGVAAGRVGRLGMDDKSQRVISLVTRNSRDARMLAEMFYGRYRTTKQGEDRRYNLAAWDVDAMHREVGRMGSEREE